jgi:hypothetical protein
MKKKCLYSIYGDESYYFMNVWCIGEKFECTLWWWGVEFLILTTYLHLGCKLGK